MSVYLYDEALLKKLKFWTEGLEVGIYGPDDTNTLFSVIADETEDKPLKLPIICLRRLGGFTIENPNKKPLTYGGMTLDSDGDASVNLHAIPIILPYQIDIYTRYLKEADVYCRNFIYNIINYPTLLVVLPYNNRHYVHNANIRVAADVKDNSGIQERLSFGLFTRYTLDINIDDAYLWDIKVSPTVAIDAGGSYIEARNPFSADFDREQLLLE